ncbi:ABC transporter ATP-binding protein [Wukongibacter sp. M2B1]|uniref:ABC transporter ATP-binding protein n=1 Tax=Wukongibacter sp. M2B1 TaxID=3088895 RepID=UPI003D7AF02D
MLLEVINGTFGYKRDENIISNINFKVGSGKVFTILGPNGVGKTTLLKCILGLYKWRKGEARLYGKPVMDISEKEFWKNISYVPQARNPAFPYTVFDMVLMGRTPYLGIMNMPRKIDKEITREIIEEIGISELSGKSCGAISGGELQLVLIARALASQPKVLVLDEPESNLDMKNQLLILEVLEKLSKEKKISCIINTHFPNHALRISDDTLMMGKDQNYIVGNTWDVVTEGNIKDIFGVKAEEIHLSNNKSKAKIIFPVKRII